jgi:hypothetical protein
MHTAFLNSDREGCNILNSDFEEFGMGTEKGEDGHVYICQLFDVERFFLKRLDLHRSVLDAIHGDKATSLTGWGKHFTRYVFCITLKAQ